MRRPHVRVHLHFVWSTWNRMPCITPDIAPRVHGSIVRQSTDLGAQVIALGGIADHVHLLVRFPATVSIAEFVKQVKGASSHLVTRVLRWPEPFRWQGGYGVFAVSEKHVAAVKRYILYQERHHREGTVHPLLERTEDSDSR